MLHPIRFAAGIALTMLLSSPVIPQASQSVRAQDTPRHSGGIDDSRHNAITRAIEVVSPAVVGINVTEIRERPVDPFYAFFYGDRSYRERFQSVGSGFIVSSDGYIITNDHVAGHASDIVVTMADGSKHPAKLVGTDPVTDVCLIRVENQKGLPSLRLGNSDDALVGEWSIAFGNPFGLFTAGAKPTVTVGVISATQVYLEQREGKVYRNMLQTDAAINSGNSGGPLVNSLGEVIGMNTVIYTPNQGSVGLGFAVPINRVRQIVDILKAEGRVNREFTPGFLVQPVDRDIAEAYNLKNIDGVVVSNIARNGSARRAGLAVGDIITVANGEPVHDVNVLEGLIRYALRGEVIALKVLRDNAEKEIQLKLE
jgi:serine protease Do